MKLQGTAEDISRKQREIMHHRALASEAGEAWGWETPAGRRRVRRRLDFLIKSAGLAKGIRALEIGCGLGIFSRELVKTGARLTAIDLSLDLLEHARRQIADVEFVHADAENLDFPEASYDAVLGISVLHHIRLDKVLQGIFKVLKPGGKMVFSEPNMMNPQIFLERNSKTIRRLAKNSPDETAFYRRPLAEEIRRAGFEKVSVVPFDFLHPWTPEPLIGAADELGRMAERIPGLCEFAGSLRIFAIKS